MKGSDSSPWQSVSGDILPYGRQSVSQSDIEAVVSVLESDWLTQGPAIETFEQEFARRCKVKYAVAVSSATGALHLGAKVLGIEKGETLWTTPNTFVASANCAKYCGGDVDFVDINPRTYNLCVNQLEEKLKDAASRGKQLPKVVVPVDFAGQSCDMESISTLADQYGFSIMQDASHAVGGRYQSRPTGDCRFSDLAVFSFHPVKIVTTGEGGLLTTNRDDLYERLIRLRNHGITRDPRQMNLDPTGPWYYEQIELGFNYRLTDFQAALGHSQLDRLPKIIHRRRLLAERYSELLADLPLALPWQHPDNESSWHLYVIRLRTDRINKTHLEIFEALRAAGIGVNLHYIPVHLQPYYQHFGFKDGDFPEAERHSREAISLPLFPDLTEQDMDKVVSVLRGVLA